MIISPNGLGLQNVLSNCKPVFVWDALRAGRCIGKGKEGATLLLTLTDNDSQAASTLWNWGDNRLVKMPADTSTALGAETVLGPCGEFYGGAVTNYHTWTTAKMGYAVVTPTGASSWLASGSDYPDILKDATGSDHCLLAYADTTVDAVNDVVVERSTSRSSAYNRDFSVLVKSTTGVDPTGNIELGWNVLAETRTTETPRLRKLPQSDWYIASIIVPSHATDTAGYSSIMFKASSGVWQTACPTFTNKYLEFEYITRFGKATTGARGKWDVHTTAAELKLRSEGWLAMSLVLPDRSVSNGHLDYAGNANYKLLGMFNLDCGTYRLRVSMSDTYDHVVVNMGTTAGVNFAFLDGPSDWDDFAALGIVATWEISNGSTYATLYINGDKMESVANPADWYPDDLATGTAYIGNFGADSTPAEAWISRVAYGTDRIHRSYARSLSREMQKLCRGYAGTI